MARGFMGKMLWVDLSRNKLKDEVLDEKLGRQFIGGYGLGARILFSRQRAGVDPLGPNSILGIITGILTGTPAISASRYIVVGKSPLESDLREESQLEYLRDCMVKAHVVFWYMSETEV